MVNKGTEFFTQICSSLSLSLQPYAHIPLIQICQTYTVRKTEVMFDSTDIGTQKLYFGARTYDSFCSCCCK